MDYLYTVFNWLKKFLYGGAEACSWLFEPINQQPAPEWLDAMNVIPVVAVIRTIINATSITPLELISIGGLTGFVIVAFCKWIIA